MSDHEPPVSDYGLLALLRFDAARDAQPTAKARVLDRLESSIGALGGAALRSSSGAVSRGDRASNVDPAPFSPFRTVAPRAPVRAMWTLGAKPAVGLITAAFMLGGAGGAGLYAVMAPPKTHTDYVERPIPVPEPRPFAFGAPDRTTDRVSRDIDAPESPKTRANPAPAVSDLTAERALLDRARKALARGDSQEAERALDQHTRRHPSGLLSEEREALAIKVLVDLGQFDDARRRAVKFRERYPRSLFGPSVDEAISTIR